MKRALDRQAAREAGDGGGEGCLRLSPLPWLGDNYCLQMDGPGMAKILSGVIGRSFTSEMQRRAWASLPILNEWKRRFPDLDPVQVHERLWQVRLIDPSGTSNSGYAWNESLQTMQSTVYGCL